MELQEKENCVGTEMTVSQDLLKPTTARKGVTLSFLVVILECAANQ